MLVIPLVRIAENLDTLRGTLMTMPRHRSCRDLSRAPSIRYDRELTSSDMTQSENASAQFAHRLAHLSLSGFGTC